jgi:hypothetical protein
VPGTSKEFNRYEIYYYTDRPFAPFQAMIYCYQDQQYVGRIVFYSEGSVPMSSQASLHYAFSRFADVITMLRHEKPLYLSWDSYTDGADEVWWGTIATSQEPTSE